MYNTINKKIKKQKNSFEYTYSPVHQILPKGAVFIGYAMRAVIAVVIVFGLLLFITDAFRFDISGFYLFLISFISTAVFSVMCISLTSGLIVSGLIAVSIFICTLTIDNFLGYITGSILTMWNGMMTRLSNAGYQTFGVFNFYLGEIELSESELLLIAMILAGTLLSLIYTLSIIRRTKMFPILIVGIAICSSIFTYNISSSNTGFALLLTALCAVIVLKFYDSLYANGRDKSIKQTATGGFAGFAALILAMLLIFIPANSIRKRWIEIEYINDKLEYARAVISSVIIGDTPNMSDLGFVGNMDTLNTRNTKAEERSFTGKTMMTVQAAFNTPIYLRSWVGTYYKNDSWYSAYKDDVDKYKSTFSDLFTPEQIMYNFLKTVDPKLVNFNINSSSYGNHIEDGYITTPVDISNVKSTGNLLYVPAFINPETSFMKHGSREYEPYTSDWDNYFEGIITTSWFNFNKTYRSLAYVPIYRNPDFADRLHNNNLYYKYALSYIHEYGNSNLTEEAQNIHIAEFESYLENQEIEFSKPSILERYFEMDNVEKQNFIYTNSTIPELYGNFVKDNYLSVPEEDMYEVIYPIRTEILDELRKESANITTHDVILAVVDYLAENYTYTLSPQMPLNKDSSALRVFLNETKEGYCVQFATSATMLLRSMGIPTRYVEGYVASGFRRNEAQGRAGNYITDVHDYDAHAWIEIYADGIGWMQYEATPQYYIEMYAPYEPLRTQSSSGSSYMEEPIEPELEDIDITPAVSGNSNNNIIISGVIFIIAAVIAGVIVFNWQIKSKKAVQKRYDTINDAIKSMHGGESKRELAKSLNDYIMQIYSIEGCIPDKGELPADYARRISIAMKDTEFNDIMSYMEKEEFGHGVTHDELKNLARYLQQLWENIYYKQNPLKRFWLRHFKRVI